MVTKLPVLPAQMGVWSVAIPSNVIGKIIVGGIIRVAELRSRLGGVQGRRGADGVERVKTARWKQKGLSCLGMREPLKIPIFPPWFGIAK